MYISEVIEQLESLKRSYGELSVICQDQELVGCGYIRNTYFMEGYSSCYDTKEFYELRVHQGEEND